MSIFFSCCYSGCVTLTTASSCTTLSAAEKQRQYRARRDADEQRRQWYLEKEKEKWRKDIETGKKKRQKDRSMREQLAQRKKWREAHKRCNARKKALERLNTPPSNVPGLPNMKGSWFSGAENTHRSAVTCLNDYRPVALTPVIMKCFERIVLKHIKDIIPAGLDQYQFAYRENRSTEDAVSIALHTALTHLQLPNTYVRMLLFVDFSSAFNTVIPGQADTEAPQPGTALIAVPLDQGLPHQQASGALFTLFTSDCSAIHSTNTIVKFADDTTIVGLISDNDETHYREEIQHLTQ
ncbi:hypothetical protein L3Q82_005093 [Scortum barcoo]|uniref:Uncharacterized protein n=1 Tax=Scortum barcoo TaxID=214431 RepID=A0ACB8VH58_9TELE|nr:hypothetical protein L3Q82_005093 [Scortum barcoo]